ncbi:MAG: MFS transporter [Hyphomicrobiales bacterium]|nr:MFS transporter [Hyphomicrobiales bacterium]
MADRMLRWSKPHYAWIVAAVAFTTMLVAAGVRASPGILVVPLENEFGWSRGIISLAVGLNILLYGATGPFVAALMNRFGVRRMMLFALTMIGTGVALTPFMQQSWQLVGLWGVVVGVGAGTTANVLAVTVAARWFTKHRGLVTGLMLSATATGQLMFLPLLAAISTSAGWRMVSVTVAACALGLLPFVWLLMRDHPQDMGLAPYGDTEAPKPVPPATGNPVHEAFAALRDGLRSRDYLLLAASFFVCGASTNGLIGTHLIPACIDNGIPEVAGASMLASMAIFNFMGTTASGWLSDRVDNRALLSIYYSLRGLSLLILPFSFGNFYSLTLFVAFYGLDWFATVPPTVRITIRLFGRERSPIMFGWLMCAHQIGGASAAFFAGVLRMELGTYLQAFIISGLLCLVAAVVVLLIGLKPGAPEGKPAPQAA